MCNDFEWDDDWDEEEEYDPYPDIDILTDIARDRELLEREGLRW